MFEKRKPNIVLETVKSFNIKRTPIVILIFKKRLVFIINVFSRYAQGSKKTQSFNLCPFLTLSVRNGPSVSFRTNVPCITPLGKRKSGRLTVMTVRRSFSTKCWENSSNSKDNIITIYNTLVQARSVKKFLDRNFLFIEKVQALNFPYIAKVLVFLDYILSLAKGKAQYKI